VGGVPLWHFTFDRLTSEGRAIKERLGQDAALILYKKAARSLAVLQSIRPAPECVAFQRSFELEEYRTEARRFIDHYMIPNSFPAPEIEAVERGILRICEAVAAHPRCLVYRDFIPWNIHIAPDGELAFIDFQDMLVGSFAYDIVSLIHDRDGDFALGAAVCSRILECFMELRGLTPSFYRSYHEALLQRYFRLVGQFRLLSERLGNPVYNGWIPGCFRRIGSSLAALPEMAEVLAVLAKARPEVRRGAEESWLPAAR